MSKKVSIHTWFDGNFFPKFVEPDVSQFIDLTKTPLFKFLDAQFRQEGYLGNQGLELDDSDGDRKRVHIDDLYVLPKLSKERISAEQLAHDEIETKELSNKLLNVADVIKNNPRLIILGDPGVGKSTLIKWLLCSLSHWSDNYVKKKLKNLFPLQLIARNLDNSDIKDVSTNEFIEFLISRQGESLANLILNSEEEKEIIFSLFKSGQVLLLVDGLDEISEELKIWLAKNLKLLMIEYPSIKLLMTSRVVGFDNEAFWNEEPLEDLIKEATYFSDVLKKEFESSWKTSGHKIDLNSQILKSFEWNDKIKHEEIYNQTDIKDNFTNKQVTSIPSVYYLIPFTSEQRSAFADNWVKQYLPPNQEQRLEFVENITQINQDLAQLDALSRIPVLLNLISFIQWRRGGLPHGRAELYRRIVGTYLESMDKARKLEHKFIQAFDYQDIKYWLGKLAFFMHAGDLKLADKELTSYSTDELERLREQIHKEIGSPIHAITRSEFKSFLNLQLSEVLPINDVEEYSEQLIDYLQCRTGFLIPKGASSTEDVFGFSHLSFQEYFCAYFISTSFDDLRDDLDVLESLIKSTDQAAWGEIWQLFFEELVALGKTRKQSDRVYQSIFSSNKTRTKALLETKIISNNAVKLTDKLVTKIENELVEFYSREGLIGGAETFDCVDLLVNVSQNPDRMRELLQDLNEVHCLGFQELNWLNTLDSLNKLHLILLYEEHLNKVPDLKIEELELVFKGEEVPHLERFIDLKRLVLRSSTLKKIDGQNLPESLVSIALKNTPIEALSEFRGLPSVPCCLLHRVQGINEFKIEGEFEQTFLGFSDCEFSNLELLPKFSKLKMLVFVSCKFNSNLDWSSLLKLDELGEVSFVSFDVEHELPIPKKILNKLESLGVEVSLLKKNRDLKE